MRRRRRGWRSTSSMGRPTPASTARPTAPARGPSRSRTGATAAALATAPVTVPVADRAAAPQEGLPVYVFDGAAYTGYNGVTDAAGQVAFTLPQGDYRFRADRNGTQFWSGGTDHCALPGCTEASVTVTIPVAATVQTEPGSAYADLPAYAFDGDRYNGH